MEETFSTPNGITTGFLNEYKLFKLEEQTGFRIEDAEVICLVEGQAVLILEKINTQVINQLLNAIEQFDGFLSQNKLSSVQGVLRQAEGQLNDVLTGKSDEKMAAGALANVIALYNGLSYFFKQDLPTLMKTPLLKKARQAWEQSPTKDQVPLAQLPIEHDQVKKMFANALNQRSNASFLGGIARKYGIGQSLAKGISPSGVADNLITMTFTELDALAAGAPKPTPAGAPEQLIKQIEAEEKAGGKQAGAPAAQGQGAQQQGPAGGGAPPPSNAIVAALQNSGNTYIAENAKDIVAALASAGFSVVSTKELSQRQATPGAKPGAKPGVKPGVPLP